MHVSQKQNKPFIQTEEPTAPATGAPTEPLVRILGNVNGDGIISTIDATLIHRYLSKISTNINDEMMKPADINDDGAVSIIDITYMMRYIANLQ